MIGSRHREGGASTAAVRDVRSHPIRHKSRATDTAACSCDVLAVILENLPVILENLPVVFENVLHCSIFKLTSALPKKDNRPIPAAPL
jgi:hypothetical protein